MLQSNIKSVKGAKFIFLLSTNSSNWMLGISCNSGNVVNYSLIKVFSVVLMIFSELARVARRSVMRLIMRTTQTKINIPTWSRTIVSKASHLDKFPFVPSNHYFLTLEFDALTDFKLVHANLANVILKLKYA